MQTVVINCIVRGDKNFLKRNYFKGLYKAPDSVKARFLTGLIISSLARDLVGRVSHVWFALDMVQLCFCVRQASLIYKWSFDTLRTVSVGEGLLRGRQTTVAHFLLLI